MSGVYSSIFQSTLPKETGYEDASRFPWPDYSEYKILRYVVGSKGRADFREGESDEWDKLNDSFALYKKGGDRLFQISFIKKIGRRGEYSKVLEAAGVSFQEYDGTGVWNYVLIDLLTVKDVGKEKKYYR
jgi:hypothetical protein